MSTVKISDLALIPQLNANTGNTLFVAVDIPTGVTGKFTGTTLAEGLYSHNPLNVGNNHIIAASAIGQFSGNNNSYLQVNLQNFTSSGSGDYIVTADDGTDTTNYIDLGINGSTFSNPNYSSMYPNDGYLYVNGDDVSTSHGNLVIGTASSDTKTVLIAGGTTNSNIVGYVTKTGLTLNTGRYFTFADGTTQSTAAASNAYSIATLTIANSASANTVYLFGALNQTNTNIGLANTQLKAYTDGQISYAAGVDITQNTRLSTVEANTVYLFGALNQTNTNIVSANTQLKAYTDGQFLANTNGNTFAGTLNISDKLNVNGSVTLSNTQFTATESALTIAACPIGDIQLPSNDGYMIHVSGKQNVASRLIIDSFGANTYAVIAGRTARGTTTAPQAVANGDILMRMSGNGYGTTKFSTLGSGRIDIVATENFTDAARSTQIQFFTTMSGTNTQTQIASFNGTTAVFNGVISPQKGFIYSPNVISSNVITTFNIDIANNSLYKISCNTNIDIAINNFQYGKVVEVWLTNTTGTNKTITHGCSALNSSINSTTFVIPGTSSSYLRYFSINGDLANTYVAIQHA